MNDLFKKINQDKKLPENLEKEIMNSFDTLSLIMEVTDLFTSKFGQSEVMLHMEMDNFMRAKPPEKPTREG
ncbi:MAG: hypothetical protein OHK0053_07900 [Microscillaceae bacterium]